MKYILLFALLLTTFSSGNCQSSFQKFYGDTTSDVAYDIKRTFDNGYILCGRAEPTNVKDKYLLTKIDSAGNLQWEKAFGGSSYDMASAVIQTADSGYIVVGKSYSFTASGIVAYVVHTDANGNKLWSKAIDVAPTYEITDVVNSLDGAFYISLNTFQQFVIIKIDLNGDIISSNAYNGGTTKVLSMDACSDGGLILTGDHTIPGSPFPHTSTFLARTDSAGNLLWSYDYYYSPLEGRAQSVIQTADGGYAVTGYFETGSNSELAQLLKCDAAGNLQWYRQIIPTFGNSNGRDLEQLPDGGYIIAGVTYPGWSDNIYLMRVDSSGNVVWIKNIGTQNGDEFPYAIEKASDGGFAIAGIAWHNSTATLDIYFAKTDSSGNAGCNTIAGSATADTIIPTITSLNFVMTTDTVTIFAAADTSYDTGTETTICITTSLSSQQKEEFNIYPNPTEGKIYIHSTEDAEGVIEVTNISGIIVYRTILSADSRELNLDVPSGIYIVRLNGKEIQTRKVVVY